MNLGAFNSSSANRSLRENFGTRSSAVQNPINNYGQRTWQKKEWDTFLDGFINSYSDEKFAAHLQSGNAKEIARERNINWQADGKHELSAEQIDDLKSAYDIENMSGQDYYNLIADLTDMNVISGKDAARPNIGILPIGVVLDTAFNDTGCDGSISDFSMYSGNIYNNILTRYHEYSETLDKINQSGPYGSAGQYLDFKSYLEEETKVYSRMVGVFDKILR